MTNKIIAAAREAGFRTGNITLSGEGLAPIPFIAPLSATNCQHEVSRLYALAYRQGLEDAAKRRAPSPRELPPVGTGALLGEQQYCFNKGWKEGAASVRAAIRALKEKDHG